MPLCFSFFLGLLVVAVMMNSMMSMIKWKKVNDDGANGFDYEEEVELC